MRQFFHLGTLVLGGFLSAPSLPQASLPPGSVTPGALDQFCASQSTSTCTVPLAGEYTLALQGDWQLPESIHLQFLPGSRLHVAGGVLHFAGSTVEAPAGEHIFPDADRIRDLSATRPEWFADPGPEPLPAQALADAYAATEPWGTVYLQSGRYLSPFHGCPDSPLRYLSPRTFVGAGRPLPDDPDRPTRLEGGTILLGGISGTAPLRLANLGIDVGPEVSARQLKGCQPPGVFIEQPGRSFVSGDRLLDISVLTTGALNMHSVMLAGHQNTEVRDLWVWTLGGTHGLVMKSSHSLVDGLHCRGAVSDCLIVKSDYATDFLGRAVDVRVSHVDIQPLLPGQIVGGIVVDSRWDVVRSLDMQDISETGATYGIVLLGSIFYRPHGIAIRHWNAHAVNGICLYAMDADSVKASDVHCGLVPAAQTGMNLQGGRGTVLDGVTFRCEGEPAACAAARTDGILDNLADNSQNGFKRISGAGLGGHLLRSTHGEPPLGEYTATAMDGRLYAPYRVTFREHLLGIATQVKPNLRILYTAVTTRLLRNPEVYAFLIVLLVCMVALERKFPMRRQESRRRFQSR